MLKNIHIVDNFYDNPEVIRNLALKTDYHKFRADEHYPGYESVQSFYAKEHADRFKSIINKDIMVDKSMVYGKFRYSVKEAESISDIHIDSAEWAAMIYLSLDEDSKGGLGIYKHKQTGLITVPQTTKEFEKIGYNGFYDLDERLVYPDTFNKEAWELIEFIPVKYNRLVLFKGSQYFHSITEKFGENVENARLNHSFFFNEKK
ncbi:DUF6445 family protein [Jeotgalibacillus terrae]|uniref:DUF6445 family protein n=1 Tax=Jeotgalibacillus terrae TaxID=587735 RepID=A0ABW5ZNG2_9BACL|nr:DUF6445 family protein [Jeotgalibacillus terrae]MBM7581135.1 hypothetical protein [Jeotgalibacillus terrae]